MVAPMTVSPARLVDRHRLACDHRLVDRRAAVDSTTPSTGIFSPGRISELIADDDILHRDLGLSAAADDAGGLGLQAEELADRLAGAGLGAGLDQPPEQDQRQYGAGRLEVHLARTGGHEPWSHGDQQAVPVGSAGAQRDQAVHVGAAVPQRQPAGAVDRPAGIEHDRGNQRQLQPVVQQPSRRPACLQHLARHHRDQHRRGQHGADHDPAGQVSDLPLPLGGLCSLRGGCIGRRAACRRRRGLAGTRFPAVRRR